MRAVQRRCARCVYAGALRMREGHTGAIRESSFSSLVKQRDPN